MSLYFTMKTQNGFCTLSWVNRTALPGSGINTGTPLWWGCEAELPQGTATPSTAFPAAVIPCTEGSGETPCPAEEIRTIHPGSCRAPAEPTSLGLLNTYFPKVGQRKASSMAQVPTWGQVPLILSLWMSSSAPGPKPAPSVSVLSLALAGLCEKPGGHKAVLSLTHRLSSLGSALTSSLGGPVQLWSLPLPA